MRRNRDGIYPFSGFKRENAFQTNPIPPRLILVEGCKGALGGLGVGRAIGFEVDSLKT